jgi:hypothetical protein
MKKNNTRKIVWIGILFIFILLLLLLTITFVSKNTYAYADGQEVYTSAPIITILTHGLGGSPTDWSNNGYYTYDGGYSNVQADNIRDSYYSNAHFNILSFTHNYDSLIETLRRKNPDSAVYVVSENGNTPYIDRFDVNGNSPTGYSAISVTKKFFIKKR